MSLPDPSTPEGKSDPACFAQPIDNPVRESTDRVEPDKPLETKNTGGAPRDEHLRWCKDRAIQLLGLGDPAQAFASMQSDMRKHPETIDHIGLELGAQLLFGGHLSDRKSVRDWIEGFN